MNDTKLNKKFAVASGPINRRLQQPIASEPIKNSANIEARLQQSRAKQRLGAPLSERLPQTLRQSSARQALSAIDIIIAIGCAISAVGLMLGLIKSSVLISGFCGLLMCGFGVKLFLNAKVKSVKAQELAPTTESLVDTQDLAAFDVALEKLAVSATDETMEKILLLKTLLLRCVALMTNAQSRDVVPNEDRFFVGECIRRYLPDSIRAYLQIPEKDRSIILMEQNKSATALLHEQIDMLAQQLAAKEKGLIQLSAESLAQQQRFLSAKTKARA